MFWIENFKGIKGLWVFRDQKFKGIPRIVVGVDPSWGIRDFSAIEGVEVKTAKQFLEYRGKSSMSELLDILKLISLESSYFLVRCILIEANLGRDLIERYSEWLESEEEAIRSRIVVYKDKDKKDFVITSLNRPILLAKVREAIVEDKSIIRSSRLLEELSNLIVNRRGKEEAAPGFTDDLVFAFALALKCREDYIIRWAPLEEIREEVIPLNEVKNKYLFPVRGEGDYLDRQIEEFKKLGLSTKSLEVQKLFDEILKSRRWGA